MNSRERLLATCNHQEPDRVPIDCGSKHLSEGEEINGVTTTAADALAKVATKHVVIHTEFSKITDRY